MIVKRQEYDENYRLVTTWAPNVVAARVEFDDRWKSDVLHVYYGKDATLTDEVIVLDRNCGMYLCNDEGKTIEVIRRLQHPTRE